MANHSKKYNFILNKSFKIMFFNRRRFKRFRRFKDKFLIKKKLFFFKPVKFHHLNKINAKTTGLFLQFIFLLNKQFINFFFFKLFPKQNFNFFFTKTT